MKIRLTNIKNNGFFNSKFLTKLCEKINEQTKVLNFSPVKITKSKIGLRNVLIKTKYKEKNINSACKLILFENSKGQIKLNSRKGFTMSFIHDIELFQQQINKING